MTSRNCKNGLLTLPSNTVKRSVKYRGYGSLKVLRRSVRILLSASKVRNSILTFVHHVHMAPTATRVEYMRAAALYRRWTEERRLLVEEMRRALEYYAYMEALWLGRAAMVELSPGARAYAMRQVHYRRRIRQAFRSSWAIFDSPAAVDAEIARSEANRQRAKPPMERSGNGHPDASVAASNDGNTDRISEPLFL